jgi:signal transduction histidine kinase
MIDTVTRTLQRQHTFVADASHQLRNPLASLHLAVDNLEEHVRPSGRELFTIAQAEVGEMGTVVDHLLALTVIEGASLAATPQRLTPMVEDRVSRWQVIAAGAGMTLVVDTPGRSADDLATRAPTEALGNLLDELVANACRLSGGTRLTVRLARGVTDVVLSVSDDGVGLSDDELAKAGERFWRGRAHAHVPGTGLGLAICRELVAAWGGRLSLHKVRPTGLEARISLPASDVSGVDYGLAERK